MKRFDNFGEYMFDLLFAPLKKGKRAVNQFFIFFKVVGRELDDLKAVIFRVRDEANVASASPVMLPVHGQDRDMPRLAGEDIEAYWRSPARFFPRHTSLQACGGRSWSISPLGNPPLYGKQGGGVPTNPQRYPSRKGCPTLPGANYQLSEGSVICRPAYRIWVKKHPKMPLDILRV